MILFPSHIVVSKTSAVDPGWIALFLINSHYHGGQAVVGTDATARGISGSCWLPGFGLAADIVGWYACGGFSLRWV
jgi:hypothetical protein